MKKKVTILCTVGVISIFIGLGIHFVYSLKDDRVKTLARMDDVILEYKNFSDSIDAFNDIRNSLYLDFFDNFYYDTMGQSDQTVKEMLSNYEVSVDNVTKATTNLANLCGTIYYPDSNVNNKCKSFPSVYEQVMNSFVLDVELYNKNILQYNDYQKENGSTEVLARYDTDKKYIDYNKDRKYEGKEE